MANSTGKILALSAGLVIVIGTLVSAGVYFVNQRQAKKALRSTLEERYQALDLENERKVKRMRAVWDKYSAEDNGSRRAKLEGELLDLCTDLEMGFAEMDRVLKDRIAIDGHRNGDSGKLELLRDARQFPESMRANIDRYRRLREIVDK